LIPLENTWKIKPKIFYSCSFLIIPFLIGFFFIFIECAFHFADLGMAENASSHSFEVLERSMEQLNLKTASVASSFNGNK